MLLLREAVKVVAAVDGGEGEEDQAFDEDGAFELDGEVVQAVEVLVGGGVGGGVVDFGVELLGERGAVVLHAGHHGELRVGGEAEHRNDDGKLSGADRVGVALGCDQDQREDEVEDACGFAETVELEQRAAHDEPGLEGVGQVLEGDLCDKAEEDERADPGGEADESEGAEEDSHKRQGIGNRE